MAYATPTSAFKKRTKEEVREVVSKAPESSGVGKNMVAWPLLETFCLVMDGACKTCVLDEHQARELGNMLIKWADLYVKEHKQEDEPE